MERELRGVMWITASLAFSSKMIYHRAAIQPIVEVSTRRQYGAC